MAGLFENVHLAFLLAHEGFARQLAQTESEIRSVQAELQSAATTRARRDELRGELDQLEVAPQSGAEAVGGLQGGGDIRDIKIRIRIKIR